MRAQVQPIAHRAQKLCQGNRGRELLDILRGENLGPFRDSVKELPESVQKALLTQARCVLAGKALVSVGLFGSLLEYAMYLEEEVGTDGPPQSPLLTTWADGHVLMDAAVGIGNESPLTVVALLAKSLLSDEDLTSTAQSLAQSFPRIFMIEDVAASADGDYLLVSLRCIFSGENFSVITMDAGLPTGKLALIRLVDMPDGGQMIFGTPYLLLNRESTWLKHLEEVTRSPASPKKKKPKKDKKSRREKSSSTPRSRLRSYMRRGPAEDYWCEYLIDGFVGMRAGCVQLVGLPHLPESLPHNPYYAGLLADEWQDGLESDDIDFDENEHGLFWEELRQADGPLQSIWEQYSSDPLVVLRGLLGDICENEGYLETARQDLHEALDWLETDLPETELHGFVPVFHTYAALARVGRRRKTAIEKAEASLATLAGDEAVKRLARELQDTYFSLFQVLRVDKDKGFEARDLLRNRRVYVHEKSATASLTTEYILGAWVVDFPDGRCELEGSLLSLPQRLGEHVLDLVCKHRSEWRAKGNLGWRVRAGRVTPLVLAALCEAVNRPRLPTIVTTDGEDICFSTARYRHQNKAAITRILAEKIGPCDDGSFVLLTDNDMVKAIIRVAEATLRVECHSRQRLASTKTLLEGWLRDLISAGLDSFEDGQVAVEEAVRKGRSSPDPVPPSPELSGLLGDFLLQHVRKSLDEPVPMFSGKTIRELAHSSKDADREKARAWLQSQEDLFSDNPQTPDGVQLAPLWEELGLEH